MAEYKYRSIDLDGPTVRLLRLFKGSFSDEIHSEIFDGWVNQFQGGIPFDALSYTWGSPERLAKITTNGKIMHVTVNLYVALRYLRYEDRDRIVWIDAICIDQNNIHERNHQVRHMSYIYKEAERVIVWLGRGTKESHLAMDFLKRLQEISVNTQGDWRRFARPVINSLPAESQNKLQMGLELMLEQPWFRRIWILQEIANARVAVVLCGNKSVSAGIFAQVPSLLGIQPNSQCQAVLDIMPGLSRKESWWGQNRDLHTLLTKFCKSEATDRRDIIYALLGISSDACNSEILLPDYKKSLQQVLLDTVLFLLSHTSQDPSLYEGIDWSLPEFLASLDSLSSLALQSACKNGQEAKVKILLKTDGIQADLKDSIGRTALSWAAGNGHAAIVQLLLKGGTKVESEDNSGRTALSWTAGNGHAAIARLLLTSGAKLESRDEKGWTPLTYAARSGDEAIVRLLLSSGARLESKDERGWTPLLHAAGSGHKAIVQLLLKHGAKLESEDNSGRTPLLWTAENGQEAVVRLLLNSGAKLESKDNQNRTPLSLAAENGQENVINMLLKSGAKLESKDNRGRTPLSWAAENGHVVVVQLLLKRGASQESKDSRGWTPLLWATKNRHAAILRLLLESGDGGRTPLSLDSEDSHETIIQLLLEHSAELESKGSSGWTPLSWAAENGHVAIVMRLLRHGAELEWKSNMDRTPLSWAAGNGHKAIVELLLNYGAKVESEDTQGRTPLSWAIENEHDGVVKVLVQHGAKHKK